ncbi:hypothetical protein D3C87_1518700 [compost metagenome]
MNAHQFQRSLRGLAHRALPGIELGVLTTHRHQGEKGEVRRLEQREHVHAVAHAAALHQQHGALPAEPGTADERHPLLFRGEHDILDIGIGDGAAYHVRVTGIGHIGNLVDPALFEDLEDGLLPVRRRVGCLVHWL